VNHDGDTSLTLTSAELFEGKFCHADRDSLWKYLIAFHTVVFETSRQTVVRGLVRSSL